MSIAVFPQNKGKDQDNFLGLDPKAHLGLPIPITDPIQAWPGERKYLWNGLDGTVLMVHDIINGKPNKPTQKEPPV